MQARHRRLANAAPARWKTSLRAGLGLRPAGGCLSLLHLLLLLHVPLLLLLKLLLLLLVSLIGLRIPRIGRRRALHRRQILGMVSAGGATSVLRPWWSGFPIAAVLNSGLTGSAIGRRMIWCSGLSSRDGFAAAEDSRPGGRCDWRLALI